ncbi:UDP-glucose dehydrogenase family protein [Acidomonas methanolica]|uniref:UDP-glucose 6-dehydrogenase n=1 Tax=Acidomonas methanolica NBRC 104435 TaxID=1231351 RepID=A0A023D5L0_ACIMT|nr:UDP-glucose/GDP-mannose dehydrogenase family protein [Acidomonas methanolica]MBU2655595.1 UDP-glucose/GDP-mannose dehydrogenase family protein [Acidomonas methanolica]TCS21544.1 UDP-glucose dehydrogenase [Acidomonas methanolica]GAJ29081.1 UDP-glucose 6-dehydrogenase [Acidomonas methanolica NBRC 104435]GBQ48152.1 UDP-glucose 6-dehydrogenase [Acidomonas methanolica]GEL00426.1 UDP-glucose 6-dehydrogenase [Acidomonas methanolica NBRC 104435]
MRIAMIGGGYVGLVSGACFAEFGSDVAIVETDPAKLSALRAGEIPIYEPGLDAVVAQNIEGGRLSFGDDIAAAIHDADAVFIAVGTPTRRGDGHADLTYVYEATRQIARAARSGLLVVTKSTVPVGTGREVARILAEERPELSFSVASNPEFLREGSAIQDFLRPDRVIIGIDRRGPDGGERAERVMRELYRPLYLIETPVVMTGLETAELTKYAANAFLAMKVTFINEMADLCEKLGADVHDVARGMGLDQRIGRRFLHPGPGFGGSCFPKDTRALTAIAQDAGAPTRLIETTVAINEARKEAMAERIIAPLGGSAAGKVVGVLGLTFKPETDDMREASSLPIIARLVREGAVVRVFDPQGMQAARALLPAEVVYVEDALAAAEGADILVVLTEWNVFRAIAPERLRAAMRGRAIADLRNIWNPEAMREAGFEYQSIGRP